MSLQASGWQTPKWNQTNWKKACTNCTRGKETGSPLWRYQGPSTSADQRWVTSSCCLTVKTTTTTPRWPSRLLSCSHWGTALAVCGGGLFLKQPQALCEFDRPYKLTGPCSWGHNYICPDKSWRQQRINGHWAVCRLKGWSFWEVQQKKSAKNTNYRSLNLSDNRGADSLITKNMWDTIVRLQRYTDVVVPVPF